MSTVMFVLIEATIALVIMLYMGAVDERMETEIKLAKIDLSRNKSMLEDIEKRISKIETQRLLEEEMRNNVKCE